MKKQNRNLLIGAAVVGAYILLINKKGIKGIAGSNYTTDQLSENFKGDMIEVTKQFYYYKKNNTYDASNVLNSKVKALAYWAEELKKANK